MKKFFSAILASMFVLSSFSFVAFAADEPIVVSPSQLNLNMEQNAGMTRTITTKDGISVIKMEPNTSSTDYLVVDGYNIGSRGVTIGKHLYASVDYYYETSITDPESNPVLGRKAELKLLQLKPNSETISSDQTIQANVWTRATFDLSKTASGYTNTAGGDTLNQYHFIPLGSETKGNNANGTLYVNNLTFHTEPVGLPTITGITFAENEISIEKGYALAIPAVTVTGENSPIQDYTLTVAGHSSEDTVISGGSVFVGADETAESFTITATSVIDKTKSATMTVKVKNPAPRTAFDAENVLIRFGVVSDVHQNGYYAGTLSNAQPQEWAHAIDVLEQIAKDDGAKLDAILVAGDMVDGVANGGSNVGSFANYGLKAMQNMREVGHFAHGVWGNDITVNFTKEVGIANEARSQYAPGQDIHVKATSVSGFGNGFDETTRLFYCLGNHDENGRGYTAPITKTIDGAATKFAPVWSADYFAAVICGWQYDYSSDEALSNTREGDGEYEDGTDMSYREYIADLIDYNTNPDTTVTAETFGAKFFTPLATADALFDRYYGHLDVESTLTDKDNGLSLGNMHMTIDPNPENDTTDDRIHFIAVELSQAAASCAWAEEIIKTSVAEDPSKPVFIISHYKPKGTMYGDTDYTRLSDVLKKYPQAIIWGGHSHTSMHNDNSINSELGFVAVETNTTRYMSTSTALTLDAKFGAATSNNASYPKSAYNYPSHEAGVSNACYVEVDKNNNVRIRRVDLYRSYSADFAADSSFFTQGKYKNFNDHAYNEEFVAIDEPAFIRTPWDITDIETGKHLGDFNTTSRTNKTGIPYFDASSAITAEGVIGGLDIKFKMDAKDDGMIMLYVLEVKNSDGDVVHRRYYTNFYYEYPQDPTATYAGNNIAQREYTASISGLNPAEEYTVELFAVDDFYVPSEPISVKATTPDGDTKVDLGDGKIGVYVDTTGEYSTYNVDGTDYLVYGSFKSAIAANPDVIYYIQGNADLYTKQSDNTYKQDIAGISPTTKIIGINRDKAIFNYNASYTPPSDLYFENVSFSKNDAGDTGINLMGHTITLVNVKASSNALNIFNTGWGGADPSGTLIVKGDTGNINAIFPGPNYGNNAGSNGDVTLILEGGKYNTVGAAKARPGNKIDGNVFITVTGGTYTTVTASQASENHKVTKNAVLKLLGGEFTTVGVAGTTNVDGKDIIIMTESVKDSIPTLNKATNQIHITIPDDVSDAIGEATADANGYYTSYAIKQVEGKKSFVNGVAATSIALTAGEEYVVTYKTPSAIEYDLNGGTGTAPETYAGTAGDVVTELASGEGFSRDNYNFAGWALTPDATEAVESVTITEDGIVLYAVWTPKAYTSLTLDANGGAVEGEATVKAFVGEDTALPYAYKAKSVFIGWSADKNATTGSMTYTAVDGVESATLYAVYKDIGMEVIYVDTTAKTNGNGHSSATPMNSFANAMSAGNADGTMYVLMTTTIVSETATVGNGYQSAKGPFTLTATDPATGEKYESVAVFSTNGHYSTKSVTYDIPLAAINHTGMHVNAQGYNTYFTENATFIKKDEAIPGIDEVCSSTIYLRGRGENGTVASTYYEFDDVDVVTSDIRLIANGNSTSTTSTLVVNGGTVDKTFALYDTNKYETLNFIVNGYDATEKTLTLSGNSTIGVLNIVMNNDTANIVKYSYSATPTSTYIVKSTTEGNVEPTATAGTFKITTEEDSIYVNGQKVELSADNLYALGEAGTYEITYDQTPRHTVTYKANGGVGSDINKTVKEGAEIDLTEAPFTREGHTFLGWAEAADSNVTLASLTMGTTDVTLYAIWEAETYEVKFEVNGGNALGELAPLTKTYGEDLTLPTDYILYGTGLEFVGWSENPDAAAEEVVTTYTANKATTFFAIYNNVGTAGVTPEDELDGTYYVITESDIGVTVPGFDIPGTATEVAKYDITLIDAATGDKIQPAGEISFTATCEGIEGKAVYVYHIEEDAFEACTVSGSEVTFTTDTLSTFVIYTVEPEAQYSLVGQYNVASGIYTVSLYYNGKEANSGSFGFEYDDTVYTYGGFNYADGLSAVIPTVQKNNRVTGTWYPTEGAYIGGDDEDVLIGTFTFTCAENNYDKSLAADRFYVYTEKDADGETFNGQYYLYAPNAESSLEVVFAPIVVLDIVDNEPITVTYVVSGTLVTVREDGKAPVAPAKAVVTTESGAKVAELAIEDDETATGKVGFEFECAPGTYKLTVIKNGYLEETVEFTVEDDTSIGEIVPTAGDIRGNVDDEQGDGVIDLADFVRILRGFEASELALHVDINEDGAVNVTDLGYVKASFGKTK